MPFIPLNPEESKKYAPHPCLSPEHNPPGMMVLPPGVHKWVCPVCGEETIVESPTYTL